jgi:peptide/nickel transport system substrate-binding protein
MTLKSLLGCIGISMILALALFACAPSTPVPTEVALPTPTATPPVPTVTPVRVDTPTPTPTPKTSTAIIVGLFHDHEPDTLWPFGNPTDKQMLVQHAVMEPPMTTLDYEYQAVLFEKVPLLENGGAVITDVQVPIDPATGAITVTDTGVYTPAQQLEVTFLLRPDLFWSDGTPMTAGDSVFGFNVACAPGLGSARGSRCANIETYEALDDSTIRVVFQPNVLEMDYFTYYWDFLPEHAWGRYTPEEMVTVEQIARRLSPSYGPYMIEEWTPGESIILVRNPYYTFHGEGYPVVDKLIFKFVPDSYSLLSQLLAGQIDLVEQHGLSDLDPELLQSLEENGLLRLYPQPSRVWEHIDMNLSDPDDLSQPHPLFSDLAVRQAIAYGTNREQMAEEIFMGEVLVMNSWISPEHWAYAGDEALTLYPYDPARAGELLEEAGWILADDGFRYKDGVRLETSLHILAGQPHRERIAQFFQADMGLLGMVVNVVRVPEAEWYGETSPLSRRDFDLVEFAWIPGLEPNGQVSYSCDQIPSEENNWRGQNYMGWCNGTTTAALSSAAREISRDQRAEYYRIAQEEFTEDLPSLPLFSQLDLYAVAPEFRNLRLNSTELMTWNCWEWSLPVRGR